MEIYDKLPQVLSKDWFDIRHTGSCYGIVEEEKGAAVRNAEIIYHGKLMSINKDIFNKTDFLFYKEDDTPQNMPDLRHSCDGVLVIEKKEKKYIVFIELKSDYTQGNIRKAEKQLCASYFRTMALLQCLDINDIDQYKKCGIIVSYQLDRSKVTLYQKIKTQKARHLTWYERQGLTFAFNDFKSFPITKTYSYLGKIPVKSSLVFDELPTFHVNVNNGCDCVKFELDKILNQL